jgi:protein-L-isoaspartate(D-aspartate) O-methyltransferase
MDDWQPRAHRMVEEQLRPRGITDPRVLAAMQNTPRHLFIPAEHQSRAFADTPQPIGHGQTISQPYIVALMSQCLRLDGSERVLEVGTGSGYQAAILSQLADEVHTIEYIPELYECASKTLVELRFDNIHIHCGDGSKGLPAFAPYDAILVAAAAPRVPKPLLAQLAEKGRMVLPVGSHGFQQLELWTRGGDAFVCQPVISVAFVPLRGENGFS